jgi:quercetin dioxygenase-like cupin family protein
VPARRGPAEYFSGEVWLEPLVQSPAIDVKAIRVSFAPGARTAWHTHPGGQILIVTSGRGRYQTWGSEIVEFAAGDTIVIPAGEKHWHGAAADGPMQHLALQPIVGGSDAEWLEHVG